MKKQCRICQKTFDYCGTCSVTKDDFRAAGYCCEACYRISMILQRYGSKLATAVETMKALKPYNVDKMSLQPKIAECYQKLVDETKPKFKAITKEEVIPQEDVEVVVKDDEDMTTSENE